jgi:hypothetical protein
VTAAVAAETAESLRREVIRTRRLLSGARYLAGVVAYIAVLATVGDASRYPDKLSAAFAVALAVAGVVPAVLLGLVEVVGTRHRERTVVSYLAADAAAHGGVLAVTVPDAQPTRLGRALGAVLIGAFILASVATVAGMLPAGGVIVVVFVALVVLGGPSVFDGALSSRRLSTKPIVQLDAGPTGMRWVREDGSTQDVPWRHLLRVARRAKLSGVESVCDWTTPAPRAAVPTRYIEPASGEVVDLMTIVRAIRPRDYVSRRSIRGLGVETILEQVGTFGP